MASPADDGKAFRNALGRFATGIAVVTAADREGPTVGFTVNSFSSVSLTPPLILFSLDRSSSGFNALANAEAYAVNVLGAEQKDLSDRFASSREDKWEGVDWKAGKTGAPLLPQAIAYFECTPYAQYAGGDHDIFVGEVQAYEADEHAAPLLYFGGGYHRLRQDG